MPFPRPTLTALRAQAMQDITASSLPNADGFLRRSALRVLAWVQAGMAHLHYGYLDWIAEMAVPFTAENEFLEAWAAMAPTPVLRQSPQAASGPVTWAGLVNTVLPAGTLCARSDLVGFVTLSAATVGSGGTVTATVQAVTAGSAGNTDSGTPFTLSVVVPGITSAGTATGPISGGTDLELDQPFRGRMLESYAAPPHGGNQGDYVTWALAVPGVTRAWTNPYGMGPGTVVVYFMMDTAESAHGGFPQGVNGTAAAEPRDISATGDMLAVANYIYPLRPVTSLVYAVSPIALPVNFNIPALATATPTQLAQVSTALTTLFLNMDSPLGKTSIQQSDCNNAIETVAGLPSFTITSPANWPITSPVGYLLTLGTVNSTAPVVVANPVTFTMSPNGSLVTNTTGSLTDVVGETVTITAGGQVAFNGQPDATTANVTTIGIFNNQVYQLNQAGLWFAKAQASASYVQVPSPIPTVTATATRVVAPLTGTVTKGTWLTNLSLTVAAMPNGFIRYNLLLPFGYNANSNIVWPLVVYGHEDNEGMNGSGVYPSDGGSLVNQTVIDGTFNTIAMRTGFPAIIAVPHCDQTIDSSGQNGNSNFGGYNDTPNSGGNEQGVNAMVAYLIANYNVDSTRVYCTGDSLGGIGTLAWLVDNNQLNGVKKIWTAGLSLSDQLYRPTIANSTVYPSMKNVLFIAISTTNDNNPSSYDQPAWTYYTGGSTTYPTPSQYTASGVSALQAPGTSYYYMATTSGVPWTTYRQLNADGGQGTPLYTLLFSAVSPGTPALHTAPATTTTTSTFTTSGGKIYTPSGAVFKAKGVNITDSSMGSASTSTAGNPLMSQFPGLNFVRVACFSYQSPSYYNTFVAQMTALGVVVAFENHQNFNQDGSSAGNYGGGQGYCNTGGILTTEVNWYAALATYFAGNPYVWFMTTNEPPVNPSVAALSTWHDAILTGIRNTGNNTIIMVDVNNPNTWGTSGGMTASVYLKYHNIVWDPHYYGWLWSDGGSIGSGSGYSTNTTTVQTQMRAGIALIQQLHSADGVMPCIIAEYGNSTSGQGVDANGLLNVQQVQLLSGVYTSGCAAWLWDYIGAAYQDQLQTGSGTNLSTYGQEVAAWIASA